MKNIECLLCIFIDPFSSDDSIKDPDYNPEENIELETEKEICDKDNDISREQTEIYLRGKLQEVK